MHSVVEKVLEKCNQVKVLLLEQKNTWSIKVQSIDQKSTWGKAKICRFKSTQVQVFLKVFKQNIQIIQSMNCCVWQPVDYLHIIAT